MPCPQRPQLPRVVASVPADRGGNDRFRGLDGQGRQRVRHPGVRLGHQWGVEGVRDPQLSGRDALGGGAFAKPLQRVQPAAGDKLRRMVDAAEPHPVDAGGEPVERRLTGVDREHAAVPRGLRAGDGRAPFSQEAQGVGRVHGTGGHRRRQLPDAVADADVRPQPTVRQQFTDRDSQRPEHRLADLGRGQSRLGRLGCLGRPLVGVRVRVPHEIGQRTAEQRAQDAVRRVGPRGEAGEPSVQVGEHARPLGPLPGEHQGAAAVRLGQRGGRGVPAVRQLAEAAGPQPGRGLGELPAQLGAGGRDQAQPGREQFTGGEGVGERGRRDRRVGLHRVPDGFGVAGEQLHRARGQQQQPWPPWRGVRSCRTVRPAPRPVQDHVHVGAAEAERTDRAPAGPLLGVRPHPGPGRDAQPGLGQRQGRVGPGLRLRRDDPVI